MWRCCNLDTKSYFLLGMRLSFGIWLLYAGLFKWFGMGSEVFVGYITTEFDKTWSPHNLNVALAWIIFILEPLLGLLLVLGIKQRQVWGLTSLLMFLLLMGQTILMKPDMMINGWHYLVLTLVCASLCDPISKCGLGGSCKT